MSLSDRLDQIEQVARVIQRARDAGTVYDDAGEPLSVAETIACALDDAGMLAVPPMREEWTTVMPDGDPARGDVWTCCGMDRATAEADALSGGYTLTRRYVTEWRPA